MKEGWSESCLNGDAHTWETYKQEEWYLDRVCNACGYGEIKFNYRRHDGVHVEVDKDGEIQVTIDGRPV